MRTLVALVCATAIAAGDAPAVTPAPAPTPAATPKPAAPVPAKAYLGVAIDPAATAFSGTGLSVMRVEPNSPAAVMGILAGDRILSLDGTAVKTQDDLAKAMAARKPGDTVKIEFMRAQGKDGLAEKMQAAGVLQEAPRSRTANLGSQIADLSSRLADLSAKTKEPSLAEVLQKLQDIERDLPRAAEQFKKVYPNGEFRIAISVEITSDKTAKDPLGIDVGGKPVDKSKPKVEDPKAEPPKPDAKP